LDADKIQPTLHEALTQAYDQIARTSRIDTNKPDVNDIGCNTSYKDTPTPVHPHTTTTFLQTNPHNIKWNPRDFVYTDGSQKKGYPTLGAGVTNPNTLSTTHIDIKSQLERHKISRAEVAATTVALRQENTQDHLNILTDSSFCINTIRNYPIDPTSFNHRLHKDLLQLTD
jgi:hypothetical protein